VVFEGCGLISQGCQNSATAERLLTNQSTAQHIINVQCSNSSTCSNLGVQTKENEINLKKKK